MSHEFEFSFDESGSVDMADRTSALDKADIDQLTAIADRYPQRRTAVLPMLHYVQAVDHRISPRGIELVAQIAGVSTAQVSGVATFYTMYRRQRAGTHHIGVCTTTLCAVMGGDAVLKAVEDRLGIQPDQTTPDGMFSLERIECNAACDFAPIMMVNWEFMDNMTPQKAVQILDDLAAGQEVRSTRGPVITSWADNERVLAGLDDGQADEGPSAGAASLAGVRLAERHHWTAPQAAQAPVTQPASPAAVPPAAPAEKPASTHTPTTPVRRTRSGKGGTK
jgi:NADH-quinone oxidoreductase subunit E